MKRTRLARKTPLKRYTRMKPISDKQRKLNRDTKGLRRDPIEKFGVLCDCGCGKPARDPHELVAGAGYREKCMKHPRLILYLAGDCHKRIQGMPYAKQIAIVVRAMVRAVNEVRSCKCVSEEKVAMFLTNPNTD